MEFAIVLPILLLLILGILCFGSLEDYSNQITQLSEEGVRWAAVNDNPSTTSQTLQQYIQSQLAAGDLTVTASNVYLYYPTGSSNTIGDSVRACIVATVQYPFVGFAGANSTIVQSSTMRIEQTATAWSVSGSVPASCPTS